MLSQHTLINVWKTSDVLQQLKGVPIKVLHKKKNSFDCNNYMEISHVVHAGKVLLKSSRLALAATANKGESSPGTSAASVRRD